MARKPPKPTEANQRRFVTRHLNGGSFPCDCNDYYLEVIKKEDKYETHNHACFAAMKWLDKMGVRTLEEAWNRCGRGTWLVWMLDEMGWLTLSIEEIIWSADTVSRTDRGFANQLRKRLHNPWTMEGWEKGLVKQ